MADGYGKIMVDAIVDSNSTTHQTSELQSVYEVISRAKNVVSNETVELAVGTISDAKYFFDTDSEKTFWYPQGTLSGSLTAVGALTTNNTISATVGGTAYDLVLTDQTKIINVVDYGAVALTDGDQTTTTIAMNETAFENAISAAAESGASVYVPASSPKMYHITNTISNTGVRIFGAGESASIIKQIDTTTNFTWSSSNRISSNPMFEMTADNCYFDHLWLQPVNEGIASNPSSTLSGLYISHVKIYNPSTSNGDGVVWFTTNTVRIDSCHISHCGAFGSWTGDSDGGTQTYGHANALDFGASTDVRITNNYLSYNGYCGIYDYGVRLLIIDHNTFEYNGCSACQHNPHASYKGFTFVNNTTRYNGGDSLDINNTATSIIDIDAVISGNVNYQNGYFGGDTDSPTQDGSGIVTLRGVGKYVISNNIDYDCGGTGVYITDTANGNVHDNIIIKSTTTANGIYTGSDGVGTISNLLLHNNIISVVGTAYNMSSSITYSNLKVDNNYIESTSYAITFGSSSTFDDATFNGFNNNTIITGNVLYPTINISGGSIASTGTTIDVVYLNAANVELNNVRISAATTGALIRVYNHNYCKLVGVVAENTGTGPAVVINGATGTRIINSDLTADSGSGLSLTSNGTNYATDTDIAYTYLTSASGAAISVSSTSVDTYMNRVTISGTETYGTYPYAADYTQMTA